MSNKELNQLELFSKVKEGLITLKKACELSKLSRKQTKRKYKRYLKEGPPGLIHKGVGKRGNRALPDETVAEIVKILKERYTGFGPTLAAEKLYENHDIKIDHETIRRIMIKHGLHKSRKKKSNYREWREPKHHKGELVQADGSYHQWFNEEYCTLIAFIDDATGEVFARFRDESTEGVAITFKEYIKQNGIPRSIYCDRGKVFKVNNSQDKQAITQFERMLTELNCETTHAYSPQAKGRVERLFKTLQDRLAKDLKLNNITATEEANIFLVKFLKQFNKKFAKVPKDPTDLHQSADKYDLNSILCYKYKRKLNNDYTISFKNRWFQILKKQSTVLYRTDAIDVYLAFDGTISLWKNGFRLNFKPIEKPIKQMVKKQIIKSDRKQPYRPPKDHPWRKWDPTKQVDISIELKKGHF